MEKAGLCYQTHLPGRAVLVGQVGLELVAKTAVTVMVGHVSWAYSDRGTLLQRGKLRLAEEMSSCGRLLPRVVI